ncbi:hypothetical protein FG386_002121 [Cryptosporidium ryanae]|uniref:uncharacterized protein n=1 Tax=Cryptosporidium ryanae TaxID=515981 RepID=UPI00351A00BE|nr:hypothetical protein FG386_002121 [Cryptosporidium ryanae]
MEDFIREYSVSPNQYCREKEFTTTGFTSRNTHIKHYYHRFRSNSSKGKKGTAILIHGYSSHTLGEYLNVVENQKCSRINDNKYYYSSESGKEIENPLLKSKYITTYDGSYIEYFNNNGYDVISLDLEGHGFSKGKKCNTENLDNNCYSIIQMLEVEISKYKPNGKYYLDKYNVSVYNWNSKISEEKGSNGDKQYSIESDEKENLYNKGNLFEHKVDNNNSISRKKGACIHCGSNECVFKSVFGDKLVVCGISMGGATAFRLIELIGQMIEENKQEYLKLIHCIKPRIICTILLSPMLSLESIKKKPLNRFLLMFLSIASYLFPDLQVGEKIKNPSCDYLSLFSKNDPLCYSKRVKALMCKSLLGFTDTIRKDINYYPADIPLLICHCIHDSLTDFEGSKRTIELLNDKFGDTQLESNTNPEFTLWPITSKKMWHALTREVGFQDLLLRILDWVSKKEIQYEKRYKQINKIEKTPSTSQQIFISFKKNYFQKLKK